MRTQVAIIGAGPAGLLLSHLLQLQGICSVTLESRDRNYVEGRVRAGVLEQGTVDTLHEAGVGARLAAEGLPHAGTELRFAGRGHRIDFVELTGRQITVYGQQEVVKDLIAKRLADQADLRFEVTEVSISELDTDRPIVRFEQAGQQCRLAADFVIGADGSHGICRDLLTAPAGYQHEYPYAWLGILAEAPPSSAELIYARHERGFALHSMRSPSVTRMYLQVPPETELADWSEDRIWAELHARFTDLDGFKLTEGPLLDRSITGMRSFVAGSMRHRRLLLAGDAAHIVPPTGAKGMNLAIADVRLLSRAIGGFYADRRTDLLAGYPEQALRRVWRATHFSWWMTEMLHVPPTGDPFAHQLALAQLEYLVSSTAMATAFAENYTGLPYQHGWSYR